jgi:hypothetical protein
VAVPPATSRTAVVRREFALCVPTAWQRLHFAVVCSVHSFPGGGRVAPRADRSALRPHGYHADAVAVDTVVDWLGAPSSRHDKLHMRPNLRKEMVAELLRNLNFRKGKRMWATGSHPLVASPPCFAASLKYTT